MDSQKTNKQNKSYMKVYFLKDLSQYGANRVIVNTSICVLLM